MESKPITPKTMTIQKVLDVIVTGKFNELIGTLESDVIEFKGAPYQLDSLENKIELAKDVSALANVGGGIIVMGIKTYIVEGYPHEIVEQIRSFEETIFDIKQYENVIDKWIYPRLNLEICWVPSIADNTRGIAYIRVPESQSERKPFLTVGVHQENDKVLGNVVGFFQRRGDKVVHWSAEELHHAFKDGLRFDEHLSGIGETLGEILSQRKTTESYEIDQEIIERRITNAIEAVGLADSTSYVLLSYPETTVEITGMFESRTSDVVKLIDDPPELRCYGFDIKTGERSRIVNGEFRRSVLKSYKLLDVWRDGTIVSIGDGDEGFLCWGDYTKKEFLRINTLALIESVYLFNLFVSRVFEAGGVPDSNLQMELQIRNIPIGGKYGLPKAKPGSLAWQYNMDRSIAWTSEKNLSLCKSWILKKTVPEKVAYELVSELYAKFGVEHEHIPYVKEENSEKLIDVEHIRNIR